MSEPSSVVLALAAGVFGRAHPGWGCALLCGASWLLWGELRTRLGRLAALALLGALCGSGWWAAKPPPPTLLPLDENLRFRGNVLEDPTRVEGGVRALVGLTAFAPAEPGPAPWQPACGRVVLHVEGVPEPPPGRGDVAVFRGRLRPPWGFRNPGSEGFERYLERKGVEARTFAAYPGGAVFAAPGAGAPGWLRWRRERARAIWRVVPGPPGAVLAALTLGDWSAVLPATADSFRRAGTTHLLAISGLHLCVLAVLVLPGVRWCLVRVPLLPLATPVEPLARLLVLPVLAGYTALAGAQASTLRSLAMTGLLVAGSALSRPVSALGVLAAAVALLAVVHPPVLGDPGLQLSAAALAGLFWLAPRLEARLAGEPVPDDPLAPPAHPAAKRLAALGRGFRRLAVAGVAASAATAPVSLFHFGSSSLLGLVVNPLAVPWVEFLCLPAGLVGTVLQGLWPGAGAWVLRAVGLALEGLLRVQDALVPGVPLVSFPLAATPSGCLGVFLLLAALGLALERPPQGRRARVALAAGLGFLFVPVGVTRLVAAQDGSAHLWALDVGQGQALVVKTPDDRWLLIDAGGFPSSEVDTGARVVTPALTALGAPRLWLAVSTHPHPDHVLGLASAVGFGKPRRLWLPASFAGDARYDDVLDAARGAGTAVEWLGPAGAVHRERVGSVLVEAVWVEGPRENDRSLVLRLTCGGTSVLLPADVEAAGQQRLLAGGFDPRCRLLVAPHHGSAGAVWGPFLDAARPEAVFVSASGRGSLPSEEFRLEAARRRWPVFSTFASGALHAAFGPEGLRAEPAAQSGRRSSSSVRLGTW